MNGLPGNRATLRLVLGFALVASAAAALVFMLLIVDSTGWDEAWLQFALLPVALLLVLAAGLVLILNWRRTGASVLPPSVPVLVAGFVLVLGAQVAFIGAVWAGIACMAFGLGMLLFRGRVS
ncbi:MAG: hypothetical protein AAF229_11060 [Pseudomonadota bacterium]